jgi:hypothetical protein
MGALADAAPPLMSPVGCGRMRRSLAPCDEQIRTLIIEDEFTDATNSAQKDFAKNALEVEGVDDIWCAGSRD